MTSLMLPVDMQETNERMYSRKHIDDYIRQEILGEPAFVEKIEEGVQRLEEWRNQSYYESKQKRVDQLAPLDLEHLVTEIFVGVVYCLKPELFTSVTAQMAGRLKFSDKGDGIRTIAEIMSVLCMTDVFDIMKPTPMSSLMVVSNYQPSQQLLDFIQQSAYLPPMVCEPSTLKSNYQSAHLTFNDSLILGKGNHHDGDICLDVLNSKNAVPLSLDTDFLSSVEETPTFNLDTPDKMQDWHDFKLQSYKFYHLMVSQGNRFYLTHKVDKRGRIYAQGYHISTQGTAFKKAAIELADKEHIDVPKEFLSKL